MQFISTPLPIDVQRTLDRIGEINRKKAATWEDAVEQTCAKFGCKYREIADKEESKTFFADMLTKSGNFTPQDAKECLK